MRYLAFKPVLALLLLSVTPLCVTPATAGERLDRTAREVLAPHKAIYNIEMISRRSSSQILNIHGQMYFSLLPSCEAWSTDHRFNLYYEYSDSAPMQITSDFTTYETLDGQSFDFSSRRKRDGELYQELRGSVARNQNGQGVVTYSQPVGLSFEMPAGSLFPMAHTAAMMKNIRTGQKIFSAVVFDGSDEEGPIEINTVVGKAVNVMATLQPGPAIDTTLINSPARRARMAFFPLASTGPEADYEMDVILHDNGVISDMTVDYGEFSVSQKLVALENIAGPACDDKTPAKLENPGKPDKSEPPQENPKRKMFRLIP